MKELSVFVDESGDFGKETNHSPYYLITLVFHDQSKKIDTAVQHLNSCLTLMGLPTDYYIHAGPIIRREGQYRNLSLEKRRRLISRLFAFFRDTKTTYKIFQIEKHETKDAITSVGRLSKQLYEFITENQKEFCTYDTIKIYYDNGQQEVTKIIYQTFNALLQNVEPKKPRPKDYKLFQVADLVCTLHLIHQKMLVHKLSKSELKFFYSERKLKKNYLSSMTKKEFEGKL